MFEHRSAMMFVAHKSSTTAQGKQKTWKEHGAMQFTDFETYREERKNDMNTLQKVGLYET